MAPEGPRRSGSRWTDGLRPGSWLPGGTFGSALGPSLGRRTVRIGVTGLARAGKTAFLTSVAANLAALGRGRREALPAVSEAMGGAVPVVRASPAGAEPIPRFDGPAHLAALSRDQPAWPPRTDAVSLLALDVDLPPAARMLPPRRLRLELLDYPGEWLLDLPLLRQDFAHWSRGVVARLEQPALVETMQPFLAFIRALPAQAGADEALAQAGHALYVAALRRLRDVHAMALLQPGRFLMPPPGPMPPWMTFFPLPEGQGALARMLARRFDAYRAAAAEALTEPFFAGIDRLVVLADLLTPLSQGEAAFADTQAALSEVARALRWRGGWLQVLAQLGPAAADVLRGRASPRALLGGGIGRVAFAATKADHVAQRQRGNLRALAASLTEDAVPDATHNPALMQRSFAIASVRCTEDIIWALDGRPVSAVRGRRLGEDGHTRSYPGEVPDRSPDAAFFAHPFLAVPEFEPMRPSGAGREGVPQIGLDAVLAFLLADVL